MDYKNFIASLTSEQKKSLTEKNDCKGIQSLLFHFGGIGFFTVLILMNTKLMPVFMLLQGIFIIFLFTLLHETVHRSPFASAKLNHLSGLICSYLIFLPAQWFRFFHFEHHRYTHIPGKDPELDEPKPTTLLAYVIHVSGIPIWISQAKTLLNNAFGQIDCRFVPTSAHVDIRREARMMLGVYSFLLLISLLANSLMLLYIWIIPVLLGQPFLRLYLMAEHDRCPFVTNMFENTRTTFTNWLMRKLAWNMPYHVEHHTYPSVPFHKLPELHELIQDHLKETERGYIRFSQKYISSLSK